MTRRVAPARFTSALAETLAPDVLERFLRYVRVDTQSRRDRERSPSTPGQLDLSRMLVDELLAAGLADAELDDNGYVMATLPGTADGDRPVIGLIAHVDTSPDESGTGVEPIVHRAYDGGPVSLPRNGTVLDPETMPELVSATGHDIVSSSGDTLLGADDKAGVAEIMAAVAHLAAHPELPRPTLRIGFTPDEEIGEGATLFDVERFGARFAYTLDGSTLGELQDETFTAAEAILTIHGVDVHPGFATGKLVNASRLAARVLAALPSDTLTPETTSGREGFIHPYAVQGSAGTAVIRAIVRDFDDDRLKEHVELLRRTAEEVVGAEPAARLEIDVRHQYPNMRSHLEPFPEVVRAAELAIEAEGIVPVRTPIRGGTDGSRLSAMGLPTPNLFTGGHEYHSVREWASVRDMAAATATIVRLAEVWATDGA
ncbi:MAG: tripeptide aminopeptidase [Solirubrobacteraceae bacterium]|nr:tripeptide aminopeptidase [Solirubrobacteraceae bacterium]